MLSLEERLRAIEILSSYDKNNMYNSVYVNGQSMTVIDGMLRYGFEGYASMSDTSLLRALNKLYKEKQDYNAQSFITQLAADKILLGD